MLTNNIIGTGFARLAAQHNYTIIPVSCVGPEDILNILFDIPIRFIMRREFYLPIPFPASFAAPFQRFYFKFGTVRTFISIYIAFNWSLLANQRAARVTT